MKFGFFFAFSFYGGANRSHPPPFERFFFGGPPFKNIHTVTAPCSLLPFFSPGHRRTSACHIRPSSLANRFIVGGILRAPGPAIECTL